MIHLMSRFDNNGERYRVLCKIAFRRGQVPRGRANNTPDLHKVYATSLYVYLCERVLENLFSTHTTTVLCPILTNAGSVRPRTDIQSLINPGKGRTSRDYANLLADFGFSALVSYSFPASFESQVCRKIFNSKKIMVVQS